MNKLFELIGNSKLSLAFLTARVNNTLSVFTRTLTRLSKLSDQLDKIVEQSDNTVLKQNDKIVKVQAKADLKVAKANVKIEDQTAVKSAVEAKRVQIATVQKNLRKILED